STRLVDRLDACRPRFLRRLEGHLLPLELQGAAVGVLRAGQTLDEGRLAGAVVADHREDLAGVEAEVDAPESDHAAEQLDQARGLEDWLGAALRSLLREGRRLGHAFTLLIHWSTDTARITRIPVASTW